MNKVMLDINEINEEYVKCYSDTSRVYMIEHYLKTYSMRDRKDVPFLLFPRQKDLLDNIRTHKNNITTKPRQAGITTTTAGFVSCEIALASPDSPETVLIVGRDLKLSQNLLEKIEAFLYQLPRWFWGPDYFSLDPKAEENKRDIFKIHNKSRLELCNGCKVYAISSGANAARGISSVSWLIFDEAAFIENGLDVYSQAVATTATGGHTIMISTPYGKDQLYYGIYNNAMQGKNDFCVTELRWYQDPRYNEFLKWELRDDDGKIIDTYEEPILNEKGAVEYLPEHWAEMVRKGYKATSPWYVGMCNKMNNDPQRIAQELDVSFVGSSDNVIDPSIIEMHNSMNVREPDANLRDISLQETWVWKAPIEGHRYLMAIDNSRGDADDATALEIIDLDGIDDDGKPCIEQVLEYSGKLFGDAIGEIAYNYGRLYNDAFCVVESIGGYGDATLLTLMNLKYPQLYYDDVDLKTYTIQNRNSNFSVTNDGKLPGFHSSSVRFQMLSNFANLVRTNQFKIRSKRVTTELDTWVWKNGRQDHMDGFHDDTLTCLAMGLFVMQYSMNKQIENKAKDAAMIRALIMANSRIVFEPNGRKNMEDKPKYAQSLYIYNKSEGTSVRDQYKSCMWLFK